MFRYVVEMTYVLAALPNSVMEPTVYKQYGVYISPQQHYIISLEYEGKEESRGVEKPRWREGRGWSQIM